jgi:putative membrane protein (TIGR04086 family)
MRKIDDKKNLSHGFVMSAAIGTAVGFMVILILFALFAAIIASGKLSDGMMTYITAFSAFIGALIGAVVAVKRLRGKIMTVSLSVGALMFLLTLITSAFSESGALIGKLTPALCVSLILGAIAGGLLNIRRKKHKHA